MDEIVIDGLAEDDFRRSIETMLRRGKTDDAAARLKVLLPLHCGPGRLLPERFLSVSPADIEIRGWDDLGARLARHDRPGQPITAISIQTFVSDEESGDHGAFLPRLATSYFNDAAFPFSEADRDDLLEGYTVYGCQWDGDFEDHDEMLSLVGIEDLHRAVAELEADLMSTDAPSPYAIEAGAVGACYLGVLLQQAIGDAVRTRGLPRTLSVFAGNSGIYPFFDAPVVAAAEVASDAEPSPVGFDDEREEPASEMASLESLMGLSAKRPAKRPVIVFDAAEEPPAAEPEHEHEHEHEHGHEPRPEGEPVVEPEPEPRFIIIEPEPEIPSRPEPMHEPKYEPEYEPEYGRQRELEPAARLEPEPMPEPEPARSPAPAPAGEPPLAQVLPLRPPIPAAPLATEREPADPPMMTTRELIAFLRARDPDMRAETAAGDDPHVAEAAKTVDSSPPPQPHRTRRLRMAEPAPEPKSRQWLDKLWELPAVRSLSAWLRGS